MNTHPIVNPNVITIPWNAQPAKVVPLESLESLKSECCMFGVEEGSEFIRLVGCDKVLQWIMMSRTQHQV